MMTIQWNTYHDYDGEFVRHAHAQVSDDIGLRLLEITLVLRGGERRMDYLGILVFGADPMQSVRVSRSTAELILNLLCAMGVREL